MHSIRDLYSQWRDISYQMMSMIRYLQQLERSLIGRLLMKENNFSLSIIKLASATLAVCVPRFISIFPLGSVLSCFLRYLRSYLNVTNGSSIPLPCSNLELCLLPIFTAESNKSISTPSFIILLYTLPISPIAIDGNIGNNAILL